MSLQESSSDPLASIQSSLVSAANASSSFVPSNSAGISAVASDPAASTAFLIEGPTAEYTTARNCELYTVGALNERSYAVGTKKGKSKSLQKTYVFVMIL